MKNIIEQRAFALILDNTAADDEGRSLSGYASVFNSDSLDLGGFIERVAPTAFDRSLQAAAAGEVSIQALWSHDSRQPLGSTRGGKLTLASDERGLRFTLDTTRFTPAQLDAARDGDLQVSFGFRVIADTWERRDGDLPLRTLIDVDLIEISPVVNPAYPATEAALRSMEEWAKTEERTTEDKYSASARARLRMKLKLHQRKS